MADHKITVHSEDGIWLLGAVDDYPFEAKVCDEASRQGDQAAHSRQTGFR